MGPGLKKNGIRAGGLFEGKLTSNKRKTSNRALQMGFVWEIGLGEYKSTPVHEGLIFFIISVKLLILVTSVSHRPWFNLENRHPSKIVKPTKDMLLICINFTFIVRTDLYFILFYTDALRIRFLINL